MHAAPPTSPPRTWSVTLTAWAVILVSGVLIPISGISLLMILAGSYGTETFDPLGFLTIVVLPPASFLAGIGLLLRMRWAWLFMVALLAVLLAVNAADLLDGSSTTTTRTGPDGTTTTEIADYGGDMFALPLVVASLVLLAALLSPAARAEF